MDGPLPFDTFRHLDDLFAGFGGDVRRARDLFSPNDEDDLFIRCGMIGFARHLSLDYWTYDHFRHVQVLRDEVSGDDYTDGWRQFVCLAAGYFLGLRAAGRISDIDLRLAAFHTAGFMFGHPQAFDVADDGNDL